MEQKPIREYNGQTYSIEEGAELIKELDDRTRNDEDGYNSIAELAAHVKRESIRIALSPAYEDLEDEMRMPGFVATYAFRVLGFKTVVGIAPTGSGITVKMLKNGSPITTTHAIIPNSGNVSTGTPVFSDDEFDVGDVMEFEIPTGGVGSSTAGQNLQAEIIILKL
jgi:hypothetical protein